jgi:hypothetical protein
MASRTSRAFPTACPKGASMLVRTARTRREAPFPMATMASARALAASRVFMKAPLPTFTSRTMLLAPAASFLLMIELAMRGRLSTVAVTSLRA